MALATLGAVFAMSIGALREARRGADPVGGTANAGAVQK